MKPHSESQPDNAELARKAALFREGTRRIYDEQGDRADMWFFELWHFLGDVQKALEPYAAAATHIDEIIERDRQRREAEGFGHREPILQRKPLTADTHWGDR